MAACYQVLDETPARFFPFEPTALVSQHFLKKLVRAAPWSGLPSLLTALVAHELCAIPELKRLKSYPDQRARR